MNKEMEIIHRFLDGEIPEEEKDDILRKIDSETAMKREFNEIEKAIRIVKNSNRLIVPASFTSDVMRRLPARKPCKVGNVKFSV